MSPSNYREILSLEIYKFKVILKTRNRRLKTQIDKSTRGGRVRFRTHLSDFVVRVLN